MENEKTISEIFDAVYPGIVDIIKMEAQEAEEKANPPKAEIKKGTQKELDSIVENLMPWEPKPADEKDPSKPTDHQVMVNRIIDNIM